MVAVRGDRNHCATRGTVTALGTLAIRSGRICPWEILFANRVLPRRKFDVKLQTSGENGFILEILQENKGQDSWKKFVVILLSMFRTKIAHRSFQK